MDLRAAAFLFILFFLLAFITDSLPFIKSVRKISAFSKDSLRVFSNSALNDDQKQAAMLKNSFGIFRESVRIILFTTALLAVLYFALTFSYVISPLSYDKLSIYLTSVSGIGLSIVAFISYFILRKLYERIRL